MLIHHPCFRTLFIIGLAACLCLTPASTAWTQETKPPDLDDVLEGFEDEAPEEKPGVDSVDDILEGFDEPAPAPEKVAAEGEEPEKSFGFSLSGAVSLGLTYNFAHDGPVWGGTDYRGLSRFRPRIDLEGDVRISRLWKAKVNGHGFYDLSYSLNGRGNYTRNMLDVNEEEFELGEAYIQGSLFSNLDIKVGRQIVVWGKSDTIRVVDVLNPLDVREPGLVDIEDLRLPVFMTKLDFYHGPWNLSAIAVHEIRFNKTPARGSDFFPLDVPMPYERIPDGWDKDLEFGLALKGIFSGWDLSFFYARYFDDNPHFEIVRQPIIRFPFGFPGPPVAVRRAVIEMRHARLTMVGAAANVVRGNWLLKAEAAHLDGLIYTVSPTDSRARLDVLVGVEYYGFKNTTLGLELADRHLLDYDWILSLASSLVEEDDIQSAFRLTRTFLHDTLELTILVSAFGWTGENGAYERVSLKYDFTDHWSGTIGAVWYESGDKLQYSRIGRNDRLFLELKYRF